MTFRILLTVLSLPGLVEVGLGQTEASPHLERLLEHWRWMQYWKGSTEPGAKYQAGMTATLFVFWPKQPGFTALGFCSHEMRVCQMYLNPAGDSGFESLEMFPMEEPAEAFSRFVEEVLAPHAVKPKPKDSDFETETVTLTLPALEPPPGVAERKPAPPDKLESLAKLFGCSLEKPACKNHVLIPFFGEADLPVPVYSECRRDCTSEDEPSVTWVQWKMGAWWRAVPFPVKTEAEVMRLREKIEQALMTELPK